MELSTSTSVTSLREKMSAKPSIDKTPIYLDPFWSEAEEPYGGSILRAETDPAVTPSYYKKGNLECYDVQKASMGLTKYQGYLEGCVQKYLWRWEEKNGKQDLKKALEYLVKLIETLE